VIFTTYATTIGSIQGSAFLPTYDGRTLTEITGFVTKKVCSVLSLTSSRAHPPSRVHLHFGLLTRIPITKPSQLVSWFTRPRPSSPALSKWVTVSPSAKVSEYRSASNDFYITELTSLTEITALSSGNHCPWVRPEPVNVTVLAPKFRQGGGLPAPANQSPQDVPGHQLQPDRYGLDFWESLGGITIPNPVSLGFSNSHDEPWVRGLECNRYRRSWGMDVKFRCVYSPCPSSPLWFLYNSQGRMVFWMATQK